MRASQRVSFRLNITFHRADPLPGDSSLETFRVTDDCDTIHESSPARPGPGGTAALFNCLWPLSQTQMT